MLADQECVMIAVCRCCPSKTKALVLISMATQDALSVFISLDICITIIFFISVFRVLHFHTHNTLPHMKHIPTAMSLNVITESQICIYTNYCSSNTFV